MPVRKDNREERQAQADRILERAARQERAAPAHDDRSGSGDRSEEHAHAEPARTPPVRDARAAGLI
jgi:hypothetical protein